MPVPESAAPPSVRDGFVQRGEVATLLDRYLLGLDQDRIDEVWSRSLFTGDALVEFPVGQHRGIVGLAAFHRAAMAKFAGTQHLNSGAVVDLDGDRASVRANLISTQVLRQADASTGAGGSALFSTGTYLQGEAWRTADGWRFRRLAFRLVWATGTPPN